MKRQLLLLAVMLFAVAGPAFAQTEKTVYAEITKQSNGKLKLTITADVNPDLSEKPTSDGVGKYSLSGVPSYAGTRNPIAENITSVELSENIKGAKATSTARWFDGLSNVSSIKNLNYLFDLNTEDVTDMSYMFRGCSGLTGQLNLWNFKTPNVTNMEGMFYGCNKLTGIRMDKLTTDNVTNMRSMFSGCSKLSSLNLSNFKTGKVTNMSGMFGGCKALTSLDLSNFNTSNVTTMRAMFTGCEGLTTLNVKSFNTLKVENMYEMFYNCRRLKSLDVRGFDTKNVTSMGLMFAGMSSVEDIDVSKFDTHNVNNMQSMFRDCWSQKIINVSGFNTAKVTNMNMMFTGCNTITELDVKGFDTGNVTDMAGMFSGCKKLATLDVSGFNTAKVTNMASMFYNCNVLPSLDVSKFNTANVKDMSGMFYGCNVLPSLDVSKFNTAKVENMGSMFSGCELLPEINVSNFNTAKVKDMNHMFSNCKTITDLNLSSFNTANVTDMNHMFNGCSSLTKIDVSNFKTNNVYDMWGMFKGCSSLKSLDVSKLTFNASKLGSPANSGGIEHFAKDCTGLETLNLGSNDLSVIKDRNKAFDNVGKDGDNPRPCRIIFSFDKDKLGTAIIEHTIKVPPYYNYIDGYFTIADELNCSKDPNVCKDEEYKPVAKANTDLWQSNRELTINQWNTLVVPVALTFEQLQQSFGSAVEVCSLESYSEKTIYFKSVKSGETIEANVPVLVRPHEDIKNIGYADVTIEEVPTNGLTVTSKPSTDGKTATFIGSYKRYMQLTSKDDFYFSTSRGFFVRSNGNAHIGNSRAYFTLSDHPKTALALKIDDNGVSTSIDSIDGEAIGQPEGPAYNLSGQRVGNDYKGIVIINGKKVIRK